MGNALEHYLALNPQASFTAVAWITKGYSRTGPT